jgi:O-antigen/teichoic acid export membrane protein
MQLGTSYIIIQKRQVDSTFLNTIWITRIALGFTSFFICCITAYPVAQAYNEPKLTLVLPLIGLTPLIIGFKSTRIDTSVRRLTIGRLTVLELGSTALGAMLVVGLVWLFKSIWVLAASGCIYASIEVILSHTFLEGRRNRFQWDWDAFQEVWRLGRWFIAIGVLAWLSNEMVNFIPKRIFLWRSDQNLSSIASGAGTFAICHNFIRMLQTSISFPAYAETFRVCPSDLRQNVQIGRLTIVGLTWLMLMPFVLFSRQIISLVFGSHYSYYSTSLTVSEVMPIMA